MHERGHSNPELIATINSMIRYVNLALINAESQFIKKSVKVGAKQSGVRLPEDFAKFSSFREREPEDWEIIGNKIYSSEPTEMIYLFTIPEVEVEDDVIDLPYFLFEFISRFSAGLLKGDLNKDSVGALVNKEVEKLLQTSRPIERPMQFYL